MKLSPHQKTVLDAFDAREADIAIATLYVRVYDFPEKKLSSRNMQQKLAPIFAEINRKMEAAGRRDRIVLGDIKRTYRLTKRKA